MYTLVLEEHGWVCFNIQCATKKAARSPIMVKYFEARWLSGNGSAIRLKFLGKYLKTNFGD